MESAATRIAVAIQAATANVDLEVLSLPGGSVFAVVLWLWATVVTGVGGRPFGIERASIVGIVEQDVLLEPIREGWPKIEYA